MAESKVTSVGLKGPDGFDIINSPITSRGNLEFAFSRGFTLPSISRQTSWDRAYADSHRHINKIILDEITEENIINWNDAVDHSSFQGNPHNVTFKDILNRPNTLGEYGIVDAYTKEEVRHLFNALPPSNGNGGITILTNDSWAVETDSNVYSALRTRKELDNLRELNHTHPNKAIIDSFTQKHLDILALFSIDEGNLKVGTNLFSIGEISAYGLGSGSGGGSGGGTTVSWGTELNGGVGLTVEGITKTLALKSGLDLKQDKLIAGSGITIVGNTISSTAVGGVTSVGLTAPTGFNIGNSPITSSGNLSLTFASGYSLPTTAKQNNWDTAYTHSQSEHQSIINGTGFVKVNGKTLSYDNSSYALSNHTHTFASLTSKPTTLSGYGITDATPLSTFNTHNNDNIRHITGAERTKWDGVVTDFGNLEIGGRNYLLNSDRLVDTASYAMTNYPISVPTDFKDGDWVTITIWGELGTDRASFRPFNTTGNYGFGVMSKVSEGIYRVTSQWHSSSETSNESIRLYQFPNTGTSRSTVKAIKLEKGNKATDWTPAPEDQVSDWNITDVNSFSFIKNKPTKLSDFADNIGIGAHIANKANPHSVTKAQVGLGNVDNTSDLLKPISDATQTALNTKVSKSGDTMTGNLTAPSFSTTNWKWEQVGSELQLKYNNVVAQRFLLDGSIVGLGEITAYGASTGGEGVSLLRTGGTLTGKLTVATNNFLPFELKRNSLTAGTSMNLTNNRGLIASIVGEEVNGVGNLLFRTTDGDVLKLFNNKNIEAYGLLTTPTLNTNKIEMGNGWTIEQTSTSLTIRKNGVVKGTFNA